MTDEDERFYFDTQNIYFHIYRMKFKPLPPINRQFANTMRKTQTETEQKLWRILRNRRFVNYKFRRQAPIGAYIVDFICFSQKLIIEADGSQHAENANDETRDNWFKANRYRICRFWNNEIDFNSQGVMDKTWYELTQE